MATDRENLVWALAEFAPESKRLRRYSLYSKYYEGEHRFPFGTDKYRQQFWAVFRGFCDNMCLSVVDVQAERLEMLAFTSSAATVDQEKVGAPNPGQPEDTGAAVTISVVDDPVGEAAWNEWEDEYLDLVADEVHSNAFLFGDGFAIIDENGVWVQEPGNMAVKYSSDRPGEVTLAAKRWLGDDGLFHLNVYGTAEVVKYTSKKKPEVGVKYELQDFNEDDRTALPQGMPVVHFANKAYGQYGRSELAPVIPLQDALNKAVMDLIVAMEYQAFRQRWVAGVDVELDDNGNPRAFVGEHGAGKYLAFADTETKVGEFQAGEVTQYVKVIENFRGQIARVAGVPLHYFFVAESGATTSGETLKVGEKRFERKGKRQQRCFGKQWEALMELALDITATSDGELPSLEGIDINAVWAELDARSESEEMDVLLKKAQIGVPQSQLQREVGYDDDQIKQFAEEQAENIKLGLIAAPNPAKPAQIPVGESTASVAAGGQLATAPGATPPAG